jgi:hypothetical protein
MSATRAAGPRLEAADRASAAVRAWVALYTRRLPAELAASRRELIEADLWDETRAAESLGQTAGLGPQRWGRLIRGMPADLAWRLEQRGRGRGAPRRMTMRISKGELVAIVGLTVLYATGLIGALMTVAAPDPKKWASWGPSGLAVGLALSIIGLLMAIPNPRAGFVLGLAGTVVAMAAMPWALYLFLLVPIVLGLRLAREREAVRGIAPGA